MYEITHVSSSQVTIRNIHTNILTSIRSIYNNEIIKTSVHNDRFVLCTTAETLILCDSITNKTSEIKWSNNSNTNNTNNNTNNKSNTTTNKYTNNNTNSSKEKFIFDNNNVCIIYIPSQGEVSIVEYGENDILAYFRTSYVNKHVFSLKCVGGDYDFSTSSTTTTTNNNNTTNTNNNNNNNKTSMSNSSIRRNAASATTTSNTPSIKKVVAYLIDLQTICIKDLVTSSTTSLTSNNSTSSLTIAHDMKIDWLSLNDKATLLLYRDRGQGLHLYRIHTQIRTQLITLCSYVQWVPQSDVVVGQQQQQLCVWYNLNAPDQVTMREIRGQIIYIYMCSMYDMMCMLCM